MGDVEALIEKYEDLRASLPEKDKDYAELTLDGAWEEILFDLRDLL